MNQGLVLEIQSSRLRVNHVGILAECRLAGFSTSGLSFEPLEAPASDSLSPGFIRFAADPSSLGGVVLGLAPDIETDASEGEEVQFFVPAKFE